MARVVHPRGRVAQVERLLGGITAAMDRVTVEGPTGRTEVVLRRWPEGTDHALVTHEAAVLEAVRGTEVPTPAVLAADADGSRTGVPCTVTTALPGAPDLAPHDPVSWSEQLAAAQAALHAVRPPVTGLPAVAER